MPFKKRTEMRQFYYTVERFGVFSVLGEMKEGDIKSENAEKALDFIVNGIRRNKKAVVKVEIYSDDRFKKLVAQWKSPKWVIAESIIKGDDLSNISYIKRAKYGSLIIARELKDMLRNKD